MKKEKSEWREKNTAIQGKKEKERMEGEITARQRNKEK